ncbi:MAG: antitoxin [Acidimicrobiales bacterium]
MRTLYLRNVPDEVAERLEAMAGRARMSLCAFAVRELEEVACQADNSDVLDALPDLGADARTVVADVEAARAQRWM